MIIKKYTLFLEARLADLITNLKGDSDFASQISKAKEEEFDLKKKLPKEIKLDSDSKLNLNWYNTATHDLVKKIKERTSFGSVDHFIECVQEIFSLIFPSMCGKELYKKGRYSIYSKEYDISIIVEFDLNRNMAINYEISIITILPGKKGNNIIKFIEL
jgi:hypothetical protein